ncbi:acyl-coenzyme A thioesterase 13-like [Sycon ciliatum]|uniref:acyl-coenzyme A thioesterase 13-like n=1 Tax=Sycon ciliatum TaxID=27933 RepID=UPI0020A97B24|eukprot:scpid88775/ scgid16990/ Acyl-coenzyme A thioesterase 13; Thioesterase superfamily member 2 &gt; Acyl-coenzyme A thioesterase 13; Thioesterase superfamily member 2
MAPVMKYGVDVGRKLIRLTTAGKDLNRMLKEVRLTEFSPNRCVCEMTVGEEQSNPHGTLHGAFATLLMDGVTTMAIIASGRPVPGLSVEMNMSYVQGAKTGEEIRIIGDCVKAGKSLAYANCEIRRISDDKLVATGRHIKHVEVANAPFAAPWLFTDSTDKESSV